VEVSSAEMPSTGSASIETGLVMNQRPFNSTCSTSDAVAA
jgi:hypothetical protein